MKNILFLCGPNGIGKTTIGSEIVHQRPGTAYVDSDACRVMNPFILSDDTIPIIEKNISDMILNYLSCPIIDTVIFSYGFHGRRKEVFRRVMDTLSETEFRFVPVLLWCDEEENVRRMTIDGRSTDRIRRTLTESRNSFDQVDYPRLDITKMTVQEAVNAVLEAAQL